MQRESPPRFGEEQLQAGNTLFVLEDTAASTEDASQRIALWMEQTLATQVLAFRRLTEALQAAVEALLSTQDPRRLREARDTLLASVLGELAHWQGETDDAWRSLQRDLSRDPAQYATEATGELTGPAWRQQPPHAVKPQHAQDASGPSLPDDGFKTWEHPWLPWRPGSDTSFRT
ncbi:hypothetical protein [uncultured Azohydromonas sp.]|jgi:hypothetical protein|uniref:hypothetical protein n=1 Tax=uncultured Azohydromonas sp. TaxID=487342 RepID=UPI002624EB3F|nr:hypothetical protein [uncultured Azohydromonas sp.]